MSRTIVVNTRNLLFVHNALKYVLYILVRIRGVPRWALYELEDNVQQRSSERAVTIPVHLHVQYR